MWNKSRLYYKSAVFHPKVFLPDMTHENGLGMSFRQEVSISVVVDEFSHLHWMQAIEFSQVLKFAENSFSVFLWVSINESNIVGMRVFVIRMGSQFLLSQASIHWPQLIIVSSSSEVWIYFFLYG